MQDTEIRAWIALHRTPGLSSRALSRLLTVCDDPQQAWLLPPEQLDQLGISPGARRLLASGPDRALLRKVERDVCGLQQQRITLLPVTSPDYPPLLKETVDPPPLLYVKGDVAALQRPQIAMVGSRRCSRQGAENAFALGRELARAGLTVTSGCALGIDTESHRGALVASEGCSVGVLGTGIDVVYPRRNRDLFEQLQERGALVSEFPLGTQPHRALFPQRNRLISGLSLGVLVVEAALQSGSLITARFALEQNREVFAIPGSIHNPGSEGCHHLIQQGARLVVSAPEIMEELGGWLPRAATSGPHRAVKSLWDDSTGSPDNLDPRERALVEAMGYDGVDIDLLVQRTGWDIAEVQSRLTAMEIRGFVEHSAGRYQRLVRAGIE